VYDHMMEGEGILVAVEGFGSAAGSHSPLTALKLPAESGPTAVPPHLRP
jgi:hypothetical protein